MPTVLDIFSKVQTGVWPEGIARNLVCRTKDWLATALVEIQERVPQLRASNITTVLYADTGYSCGVTYFRIPKGVIKSISTADPAVDCVGITAGYISEYAFNCRVGESAMCAAYPVAANVVAYSQYPLMYHPDLTLDLTVAPGNRVVARHGSGMLMIHPHLSSNEVIKIEWTGKRLDWTDGVDTPLSWLTDAVVINPEIYDVIEKYMRYRKVDDGDCDVAKSNRAMEVYDDKIRSLISSLRDEEELPIRQQNLC